MTSSRKTNVIKVNHIIGLVLFAVYIPEVRVSLLSPQQHYIHQLQHYIHEFGPIFCIHPKWVNWEFNRAKRIKFERKIVVKIVSGEWLISFH